MVKWLLFAITIMSGSIYTIAVMTPDRIMTLAEYISGPVRRFAVHLLNDDE
jgi:hypothetical protein